MEGDVGRRSPLGTDTTPHKHELQLVNIDTSGEQASSPTCPLNLLLPVEPAGGTSEVDLDLLDPFLSGGGGGGDRAIAASGCAVPTDELVDFREKGSREVDGSDREDDCDLQLIGDDDSDLQLIGDDALGVSGEADMENIFEEALALADQFSELDKQAAAPSGHRREASPTSPAGDDGSAYADLCQQASAEQRELERQAEEEYENRQFEQLERHVSRGELDASQSSTPPPPAADRTHPRSQLSRKETYVCKPNTGTFKIDKKQRFGTFKVDKTGTFKVPRPAASAARSLPPEPAATAGANGCPETEPEAEPEPEPESGVAQEEPLAGGATDSDVNGDLGLPSADDMNTYCQYGGGEFEARSPSPSRPPLSTSTPERQEVAGGPPRRPAGLRRLLTSTPCRSAGSSGSSIGVTPIRAPPTGSLANAEDSPAPAASLRAAALRQPAASSGPRRPAGSALRQPAASGLRQPAASGLRQPAASGLRQPASSGLRPPSATGLRALSLSASAAAPRSAAARQTAAQLRQSSAQSGSDSSVCSVRSLPGPNTSRSNPSLVADRSDCEAPSLRQPRQPPGPSSRQPARGGVRRSAGGTGSLTNISLQASHTAASGLRRPAGSRSRPQETSKLSLSQQPAGSERF